ncbi:MAG TPA: hypothetical protein VFD87_08715 [Phototrophicaceae bacterium]|jgi:hypothetical protein|nr:hypothetical protein [Phototrophicaceae bacterium]
MKLARISPGDARICPHCKAQILQSASSCPICRHVLKFNSAEVESQRLAPTTCPLFVEGTLAHPEPGEPLEYQVLMEVRDEAGKLLSRQCVGVGALRQGERRVVSLQVEMSPALGSN